jgi:hypothetical protein
VFARLMTLDPNPAVPLWTGSLRRRRAAGFGVWARLVGREWNSSARMEMSVPFDWLFRNDPDDIVSLQGRLSRCGIQD